MADDPKASWGRINLDYDVAEAKAEGDRLRAEFDNALKLMDEDPEWPMNTLNKEQQQDWPRPPSDKREAPRDFKVIAPGLKKRTTKRRATDGPATPARWGDVVAVALRARVATARDPFSDLERADVLVGALAVPKCLSWAAASLVVGERATFEAASACAFGDPKRADADLPDGVAASDDIVLDLELLQVVRPVGQGDAPVHDASGPLGAGAVLKVVEAKGEGWRTPTARSDVTYSATARFTPDAWAWPGDEDATTLVGGCSAEILDDAPRESRGTWNPAASCVRTDPLRLACEAMATGERCVAAVRAKGEAWALRLIDFAEHEDCSPADRPGSVTKRTVRRSSGAAGFPNDLDVVEVRGLVKNADGVVACCYGSAVGDAPGEAGEAVFWRLDEDARASFVSAPGALFAPLCRGLELAVKRMTVGEVADVSVRAPDLGFVRPPSTAKAPLEPRLDDMAAFHYGGVDGANSSVADARCYGAGLEARLELVSVARHGDGLAATVLSDPLKRAEQFLDLADEAKALGAAHYKRGAFARAARRYGAAVAAAAVAATALETVQPEGLRFDPEDATGFAYARPSGYSSFADDVRRDSSDATRPRPRRRRDPSEDPRPWPRRGRDPPPPRKIRVPGPRRGRDPAPLERSGCQPAPPRPIDPGTARP
mmetsp:Transcript_21573/g.66265  ORF Transcript_21573/g.66265 Transcript_21573/m.66265 type:complete len:658 (+) Transcript_21573:1275-3248(+)